MTYKLDDIEQEYEEPVAPKHQDEWGYDKEHTNKAGERTIDHLNPEEVIEFQRLRGIQANVDKGGMGVVKQRAAGTKLVVSTIAQARKNLYG